MEFTWIINKEKEGSGEKQVKTQINIASVSQGKKPKESALVVNNFGKVKKQIFIDSIEGNIDLDNL
ncbi:MAG: hypothetical protein AAF847_00210 [Bacteroidota bacterium]